MSSHIQTITLDLLPSTSTSKDTPTGALIQRTLRSLQKSSTHLIWATCATNPLKLLILRYLTYPPSSPTTTDIFAPLSALLSRPPQTTTLPTGDGSPTSLPRPYHLTDILRFTFPTPPTPSQISTFRQATDLLTTDISEASKSGGRDDNPCTLHTCHFDEEGRGHIWVSWKDEERREKFRGCGGGRANLKVLMWDEFQGCDLVGMGGDFWKPLTWLGAEVGEEGLWVFGEVEEEVGWVRWMRGVIGW